MLRTYLALAAAATALTSLTVGAHRATAAPSRAPLAQQQMRSLSRPALAPASAQPQGQVEPDPALAAVPPSAPPPLPYGLDQTPRGATPQVVALEVIPYAP